MKWTQTSTMWHDLVHFPVLKVNIYAEKTCFPKLAYPHLYINISIFCPNCEIHDMLVFPCLHCQWLVTGPRFLYLISFQIEPFTWHSIPSTPEWKLHALLNFNVHLQPEHTGKRLLRWKDTNRAVLSFLMKMQCK